MSCVFNIFAKWDNLAMVEFQIEKFICTWFCLGEPQFDGVLVRILQIPNIRNVLKQMLIVKFVISANMLHLVKSLREEIVVMSSVKVQVFDIWSRCKVLPGPAVKACCFQFTAQSSQDLSHRHHYRCHHHQQHWIAILYIIDILRA